MNLSSTLDLVLQRTLPLTCVIKLSETLWDTEPEESRKIQKNPEEFRTYINNCSDRMLNKDSTFMTTNDIITKIYQVITKIY